MRKRWIDIILVLVMLVGLGVMLYPTASDWINRERQARVMTQYRETVRSQADGEDEKEWAAAEAFNAERLNSSGRLELLDEERERYDRLLNVDGSGVMGTISIPKIDVQLPLYHGTNEEVLKTAVGHIEGSSLPTGGVGTHSVFSAHRGLPSAKLFTGLDAMEIGDSFTLRVLDRELAYEVDQILVVLPDETDALRIDPEMDLCTLVTCTPYGVNTHRLLVRGKRIQADAGEDVPPPARVVADARRLDTLMAVPVAALPLLILLLTRLLGAPRKLRNKRKDQ